ncbi:TPA: hypothetical protein ACXZT8_003708 [Salmonella enterica]
MTPETKRRILALRQALELAAWDRAGEPVPSVLRDVVSPRWQTVSHSGR